MRFRFRLFFTIVSLVFIFSAVLISFPFLLQWKRWETVVLHDPNISFSFPIVFIRYRGEEERKEGEREFLFQATEGKSLRTTPLSIAFQKETGLRSVAFLTHIAPISGLLRNIERAFPLQFSEYKKESEREFEYEGKKAAELYFTYTGSKGERIKRRMMLIVYNGNTALYVSAQARESDFDTLNIRYFNQLFTSINFDG